jgi:hypothetical protein
MGDMKPRLAVKGRTKKGIRAMEKREPKLVSFHVALDPFTLLPLACSFACIPAIASPQTVLSGLYFSKWKCWMRLRRPRTVCLTRYAVRSDGLPSTCWGPRHIPKAKKCVLSGVGVSIVIVMKSCVSWL